MFPIGKGFLTSVCVLSFYGCASFSAMAPAQPAEQGQSGALSQCAGNTELPSELTDKFEAVADEALLEMALGQPGKGKLCQGKVYKTKEDAGVTVYRAWNSTNPNSNFGNWWAFHRPEGKVSQYRSDYEICYQWSPLDTLTQCTLNASVTVVVGTGQSAECSPYLSYPTSAEKQIYIEDASNAVAECDTYDGEFNWTPVIEELAGSEQQSK